jgi:quercetin dioxygenase-like cupin family protein
MRAIFLMTAATLFAVSGLCPSAEAQPVREPALTRLDAGKPQELFNGVLNLKGRDGKEVPLRVTIRRWIMPNKAVVEKFPEEGLVIVQLRAGSLTTVIGGKREERREGAYWTVRPGEAMSLETGDDSAIIQTVTAK